MDIIHSHEASRCFVFDLQMSLRSSHASKPKRKIRLCYYACVRPPLMPIRAFSRAKTVRKVNMII